MEILFWATAITVANLVVIANLSKKVGILMVGLQSLAHNQLVLSRLLTENSNSQKVLQQTLENGLLEHDNGSSSTD